MFSKNKNKNGSKKGGGTQGSYRLSKKEQIYAHTIDLQRIKKEKDDIHSFIFEVSSFSTQRS